MNRNFLLILLGILLIALSVAAQQADVERKLSDDEINFILDKVGGVWTIEKRVFDDSTVLTEPDVRGYLIISREYWTQIEAQVVPVGDVKPFTGSFFGTTDFSSTRSIEKVLLLIRTPGKDENCSAVINTKEQLQKTWLIINDDSVTQKFEGGGSVTMKDGRFEQTRKGYTTYWKRILTPSQVF
ncbi:MAG: hypothetical protein JW737_01275 [Acidobacteria bacterium]|nr:hypothetical protein [Acidobacteriota bacterium]